MLRPLLHPLSRPLSPLLRPLLWSVVGGVRLSVSRCSEGSSGSSSVRRVDTAPVAAMVGGGWSCVRRIVGAAEAEAVAAVYDGSTQRQWPLWWVVAGGVRRVLRAAREARTVVAWLEACDGK